jgi:hypothetical protein
MASQDFTTGWQRRFLFAAYGVGTLVFCIDMSLGSLQDSSASLFEAGYVLAGAFWILSLALLLRAFVAKHARPNLWAIVLTLLFPCLAAAIVSSVLFFDSVRI